MRKPKTHEKNRLEKARLKRHSPIPKLKLKRPADPEQAKEYLRELADHLSNQSPGSRRFRFIAFAIKKFLRNGAKGDISHELGLVYEVGRPRSFEERTGNLLLARQIQKLKRDGQTMSQIANHLKRDRRALERIYNDHLPRFHQEERSAPLDTDTRNTLRELKSP